VSIPVTGNDVPARLEEYGSAAFLVTVGVDGSAKVVHILSCGTRALARSGARRVAERYGT